ncbi:MAG: glucosaminidase domain-containing protein [Acidimicrobiia bacterium]
MQKRRFPFLAAVLALAVGLAGCLPPAPPPSDGSPGSAGVPVMGQARLTADQLVAYYLAKDPSTLPYRATGATLQQLAQMYIDEGNRYNVRGDIAFAQSIVETAWFNFPDYGMVRTYNNNFAGIGACDSCGNGFQFSSALAGVRAQIQLLRNYADINSRVTNIPDPPVPELWGSNPSTASYNFDHYFAKGKAPLWNNMGNGNWATAPDYATVVIRVYNQMLTFNGLPGQCPADGLTFGPLTDAGPCPVSLRQPGRAVAATPLGGYYVMNGDGTVTAYNGAPALGSPPKFGSDLARDLAVMPDGQGYVVLTAVGILYKFGSAADPANLGSLSFPYAPGQDIYRSIAIMPDGKGYLIVDGNGNLSGYGSAAPLVAYGHPSWPDDHARSVAVMPDGKGYVILDNWGTVWKYGSATQGLVGSGSTKFWGADFARDIVIVNVFGTGFGYYVLDSYGNVFNTASLPAVTNPLAQLFADRWRSMTIVGGKPLVVRNDGITAQTRAS